MDTKLTEPPSDWSVAELARRQHGIVSRAQLDAFGLTSTAIQGRVERGRLHRVYRGVYAVGHTALTRNGRFMAAVLACGGRAPLSVTSVLPFCGACSRNAVNPSTSGSGSGDGAAGIVVHDAPLEGERLRRYGIVVTTPVRTIVDLADVVSRRRTLERAIDEAQYLGLDWRPAAPRRGRKGSGLLSSVLAVHEPGSTRTRSELEEIFLALCDSAGFPRPEVNVGIEGYECDFVWREHRVIVETDGEAAHSTHGARERDPVKDADLQIAGWRLLRLPSVRLFREPDAVADQLARMLATPAPAAPAAPHPR